MAGVVQGCDGGGIRSLRELIAAHGEALRFDLAERGWSLDAAGVTFSWVDVLAVVRFAPRTAQFREALDGPAWSRVEVMLARAIDELRTANWQRTGKKHGRPKPIRVPGDKSNQTFGKATSVLSIQEWLRARNGVAPEVR